LSTAGGSTGGLAPASTGFPSIGKKMTERQELSRDMHDDQNGLNDTG
jgi:hypothetical protein